MDAWHTGKHGSNFVLQYTRHKANHDAWSPLPSRAAVINVVVQARYHAHTETFELLNEGGGSVHVPTWLKDSSQASLIRTTATRQFENFYQTLDSLMTDF